MKNGIGLIIALFLAAGASGQKIPAWKADSLTSYLSQEKGVLVVNFWATFCAPCVKEIPDFIEQIKGLKSRGVKLLLVSLDLPSEYPGKLKAFVKKNNYSVPVVWLNETNADYFCPKADPSWSGSLPATLILNTRTGYRKFIESSLSHDELKTELETALIPQ